MFFAVLTSSAITSASVTTRQCCTTRKMALKFCFSTLNSDHMSTLQVPVHKLMAKVGTLFPTWPGAFVLFALKKILSIFFMRKSNNLHEFFTWVSAHKFFGCNVARHLLRVPTFLNFLLNNNFTISTLNGISSAIINSKFTHQFKTSLIAGVIAWFMFSQTWFVALQLYKMLIHLNAKKISAATKFFR